MSTPSDWDRLPKFLIGDADDRSFVLHLHYPRFVAEVVEADGVTQLVPDWWIDSEADYIQHELAAGREPAQSMARLLREAGDFYAGEIGRE